MIVGIDASRNRSGGAKAHLIGILEEGQPQKEGIDKVHVWAYESLLDSLPEKEWLIKHESSYLEKSLLLQIFWQIFLLPKEVKACKCDILLNTDAGAISFFRPSVTMSRDMLSYEPGEIERYKLGFSKLRLIALKFIQNRSLKRSQGVIFLTKYAGNVIQQSTGKLDCVEYIPHGVGKAFSDLKFIPTIFEGRPIKLLYVSNADLYKHQWNVVKAAENLRNLNFKVQLTLVGGGSGVALKKLKDQIQISDPDGEYVFFNEFVSQSDLPQYLLDADIYIFASSCENMPNTLIEGMSAGLPIACSNRGPMPEILQDAGVYFDPEETQSISSALQTLITDDSIREANRIKSKFLANNYSWNRCSRETWAFLNKVFKNIEIKKNV